MIHRYDLDALGLVPPGPSKPEWSIPQSTLWRESVRPVHPFAVLAAGAGIGWALWLGMARLPLVAGLAVLDAAERRDR